MQLLLIKLHTTAASFEYAHVTSKQPSSRFETGDWNTVRQLASGHKVVVFIPDEDVLLTHIKIPSKNKKQLLQAVPFALEERLADDIESLHFAIHRENDDAPTQVAVINQQRMEYWVSILQQHAIHPHYILPSLFSLPFKEDHWTLINSPQKAQLRQDKWSGFSCDSNLLSLFLAEELEKHPPQGILFAGDDSQYPVELNDLPRTNLETAQEVHHDTVVEVLELNLLNGFSRGDSPLFNINWKPWRPVAILAGLLGAAWLGMISWQNHQLDNKLARLENAIESVYTQTFPGSRIQNAPVQMRQKLAELQNDSGGQSGSPLQAIATVSPFLKKFPKIDLKEIRHQNDELLFVISAPNLSGLENFKNTLVKEGALNVEVKSSTTTADKVESTLVIKGIV